MKQRVPGSRYLLVCALALAACAGPRSEVEVYHLRDMVREGRVEYLSELIRALGAPDEVVRGSAIRALAELGDVAEPRLKQTVREESRRSGPAMLALGFGGNPESLEFIRGYEKHPVLGAPAQEADREIERRLYARVAQGDLESMEAYLDAFPESPRSQDTRRLRHVKLAKSAYEQVTGSPSIDGLERYLQEYSDTEDAPAARILLARLLIKEAQSQLDAQAFGQARTLVTRVVEFDQRREPEVKRLTAQSYLLEGKALRTASKDDQAFAALEQAARFPEFRLEAERLEADILMVQARSKLQTDAYVEGILLADRAQRLDPGRRGEVVNVKSDLSLKFQSKLQGTDAAERRRALVGMVSLGDEGGKPLELYLGNQFARKNYGGVEEVVQALAEARLATPQGMTNPGVDAVADMLVSYLKAALAASTTDVTRLFGSPEFLKSWNRDLDVLDPRQYPLVYRVEELTVKHLGLSRVGLSMKALLGQNGFDVVTGALIPEDEVRSRLASGDVGADPAAPLLTRVQLCARYASTMGAFSRSVESRPERFMAYAVGLTLPPLSAADWLQVAEGFNATLDNPAGAERSPASSSAGGLRSGQVSLISLDYDHRSLTVQIYDPVADALAGGSPSARAEATQRTLGLLLNTARIAFDVYAGIDRYTVLLGTADTPPATGAPVRGGRFDPETRMMMTQKSFAGMDWTRIRALNGTYSTDQLGLADLQWYRWNR